MVERAVRQRETQRQINKASPESDTCHMLVGRGADVLLQINSEKTAGGTCHCRGRDYKHWWGWGGNLCIGSRSYLLDCWLGSGGLFVLRGQEHNMRGINVGGPPPLLKFISMLLVSPQGVDT